MSSLSGLPSIGADAFSSGLTAVPSLSLFSTTDNPLLIPSSSSSMPPVYAELSPSSPFLSTFEEESGVDVHALPFPLPTVFTQPTPRAGYHNVKRTRTGSGENAASSLPHRRLSSSSAPSVSGCSILAGGGAAVPSRVAAAGGDGNTSAGVCLTAASAPTTRDALPAPLCRSRATRRTFQGGQSDLVFPDFSGATESTSAALLTPAESDNDEEEKDDDSAALSFNSSHLGDSLRRRVVVSEGSESRHRTWSSSVPVSVSRTNTHCVSPLTPRSGLHYQTSCLLEPAPKPDTSGTTWGGSPSSLTLPITAAPAPFSKQLPRFASVASDPMEDQPPRAPPAVHSNISGSLSDAATRSQRASSLMNHVHEVGALRRIASDSRSDILGTPSCVTSSGFFSGPAYQCLADTFANSGYDGEGSGFGSPLSPPLEVPTPVHRRTTPRSTQPVFSTGAMVRQPGTTQFALSLTSPVSVTAAPITAAAWSVGEDQSAATASKSAGAKLRRIGPLIELLPCGTSSDDDDDEDAKQRRENARAQRSAADQAAFAARYKQFLRKHVAGNAHQTRPGPSAGPRSSRPSFVAITGVAPGAGAGAGAGAGGRSSFASRSHSPRYASPASLDDAIGSPGDSRRRWGVASAAGSAVQAASRSSQHGLVLSSPHSPFSPLASGTWVLRPTPTPPPASQTTKVAPLEKGETTNATGTAGGDTPIDMHLASFGQHGRTQSMSRSLADSTMCSHGQRKLGGMAAALSQLLASCEAGDSRSSTQESSSASPMRAASPCRWSRRPAVIAAPHESSITGRGADPLASSASESWDASASEAASSTHDDSSQLTGDSQSHSFVEYHAPFDLRTFDMAAGHMLRRPHSIASIPTDLLFEQASSPLVASRPFDSRSVSRMKGSRSLPSHSVMCRQRRVSDASKFTLGGEDASSCADTW